MVWITNLRGSTGFSADLNQQPQLHVSESVLALPSLCVGFILNLTGKEMHPFQASCLRKLLSEEERGRY